MKTFNEFLQAKHMELFPALLDDSLPDHFEQWKENLTTSEIMKYADEQLLKGEA